MGVAATTSEGRVESARASALGGAGTAVGRDPTLVWNNPASMGSIADTSVTVAGSTGLFGARNGFGLYAYPFGRWVVGAGVSYYDSGEIKLNASDGTSRRLTGRREIMVAGGVAATPVPRLIAGVLLKGLYSSLVEEFHAANVIGDIGLQ